MPQRSSLGPLLLAAVLAFVGAGRAHSLWELAKGLDRLPQWDMAQNALLGLELAQDLKAVHLVAFLLDCNAHETWPFGFSLFLVPFFLARGADLSSAVLAVLTAYAALPLALGWVCREIDRRAMGAWAAILSAGLVLTSPLLALLAIVVLREIAGAVCLLAAAALYLRARRKGTLGAWRLAGLGALGVFFVKYNYGAVWVAAALLDSALRLPVSERARLVRVSREWLAGRRLVLAGLFAAVVAAAILAREGTLLYGLLVLGTATLAVLGRRRARTLLEAAAAPVRAAVETVVLPIWIWLLIPVPNHVRGVLLFLGNRDSGMLLPEGLATYPSVFLAQYAPSATIGAVVLALFGVGLYLAWRSEGGWRLLACLATVHLAATLFHPYKEPRFLATAVPLVFLLATLPVVSVLGPLLRSRPARVAATSALAAGLVLVVASAPGTHAAERWVLAAYPAYSADPRIGLALAAIEHLADRDAPVGIVGTFNELSPALAAWTLRNRPTGPEFDVVRRMPAIRDGASDAEVASALERWITKRKPRQIVTIALDAGSPYRLERDFERNVWQDRARVALAARAGVTKDAEVRIATIGMTVASYRTATPSGGR